MEYARIAHFGGVKLYRVRCSDCGGWSLVTGFGSRTCCDKPLGQVTVIGVESVVGDNRKRGKVTVGRLSRADKHVQLEAQDWCCVYCCLPFDLCEVVDRKRSRIFKPEVVWDHFVPYAFSNSHKVPYVAACSQCNGIKSSTMYFDILDARRGIEPIWTSRYEVIRILEGAPVSPVIKPFNPEGKLKGFVVKHVGPYITPSESEGP